MIMQVLRATIAPLSIGKQRKEVRQADADKSYRVSPVREWWVESTRKQNDANITRFHGLGHTATS